jgi:hypothetical protein
MFGCVKKMVCMNIEVYVDGLLIVAKDPETVIKHFKRLTTLSSKVLAHLHTL